MGTPDNPITAWIEKLKAGDERAAQEVWDQYFETLVRQADRRLGSLPRGEADEEDVAISALKSFFKYVKDGKYKNLDDRSDLRKLLSKITGRKAIALWRRHMAQKRDGGNILGESAIDLKELEGAVPLAIQESIDQLNDPTLQKIVADRFEGHTNVEIAKRLGMAERTVRRKLDRIRTIWKAEILQE